MSQAAAVPRGVNSNRLNALEQQVEELQAENLRLRGLDHSLRGEAQRERDEFANQTRAAEQRVQELTEDRTNLELLLHRAFCAAVDGWPTSRSRDQFTRDMLDIYGTPSYMGNKLRLYGREVVKPSDYHETYDARAALDSGRKE